MKPLKLHETQNMKETPLVVMKNVSKEFQSKDFMVQALDTINCEIYQNEIVAIMGTSGSGKSTLLNILAALDKPTHGELMFQGVPMIEQFQEPIASEFRKRNIGFIFQNFNLLDELTVSDNVALPLILLDEDSKKIAQKVKDVLTKMSISDLAAKKPHELSGGQKQRVAIARAIIANPLLLLADEPTGALDVNTTNDILTTLVQLKNLTNQTIILVTHDPHVSTYADRVLFFHKGKLVDSYINQVNSDNLSMIFDKFKNIQRSYLNV
ncbi:ABC transporter ATP-binding protein [Lysinibacillus capsici]|uniref:ABC transporter ATP-binding protein n=1 Tax=Lysinibacillus capsici TaxID=2115968 RepID=UPI001B478C69